MSYKFAQFFAIFNDVLWEIAVELLGMVTEQILIRLCNEYGVKETFIKVHIGFKLFGATESNSDMTFYTSQKTSLYCLAKSYFPGY